MYLGMIAEMEMVYTLRGRALWSPRRAMWTPGTALLGPRTALLGPRRALLGWGCTVLQYSAGWRGAKEPTPKNRPRATPGDAGIFWVAWV